MPLIAALTRALDACDPDASAHATRVAVLAELVARRVGYGSLESLRLGAALHDVGKLALPQALLRKCTPLTAGELASIREHPKAGVRLLGSIAAARPALPYVLFHHERWDGRGYPTGRSAGEIPLGARLLAVVDAFDAITSDRPYRRAQSQEVAVAELDRCAGSQFDPDVTRVFLHAWADGEIAVAPRAAAVA